MGNRSWSREVCEDVDQVLAEFDQNGNGAIEFEEFLEMMRLSWQQHRPPLTLDKEVAECDEGLKRKISILGDLKSARPVCWVYDLLQEVSRLAPEEPVNLESGEVPDEHSACP